MPAMVTWAWPTAASSSHAASRMASSSTAPRRRVRGGPGRALPTAVADEVAEGSLPVTVTGYLAFPIPAQVALGDHEFLILNGRDMTDTTQAQVADLPVPGASLHYKVRGSGPLLLLLLLQGGDGDADGTDALAGHLASDYTVLSYDRRGLSRSPASDPAAAIDMATHSEDASRLLAAVTSDPALVLGTSLGAVLGLDLISRHPGQVRLLGAHAPPATGLLPEPERSHATRDQEEGRAL